MPPKFRFTGFMLIVVKLLVLLNVAISVLIVLLVAPGNAPAADKFQFLLPLPGSQFPLAALCNHVALPLARAERAITRRIAMVITTRIALIRFWIFGV